MLDTEAANNLLRQLFEVWVGPEIKKRQTAGTAANGLQVYAVQVVMPVEGSIAVRLNQEIKGVMKARATRPINKGDLVRWPDIREIVAFDLTDEEGDAGHITAVLHDGKWFIGFDFEYNKSRIGRLLSIAEEFLESAKASLEPRNLRAFSENLFAATELMAKCVLLKMPDERLIRSKKHAFISAEFNRRGKLNATIKKYASLLNELSKRRSAARYGSGHLHLTPKVAAEELQTATEMYELLITEVRPRLANET